MVGFNDNVKYGSLDEIAKEVSSCTKCELHKNRTYAVPGNGPNSCSLMFIGEAPGLNEDKLGIPFVGKAGKLLNKLLENVPIYRDDIFITNVVKCRPPKNRDPLPNEVRSCKVYLDQQINIVNPRIVVSMGRYSLLHFRPEGKISLDHGKLFHWKNRALYPIYHPAAALRNKDFFRSLDIDIKRLPEILLWSLSPGFLNFVNKDDNVMDPLTYKNKECVDESSHE